MLTIAVRAARNAGSLIQRSSENIGRLTIDKKSKKATEYSGFLIVFSSQQ